MKSQIKILNDEVSELLSELYEASTQRGIHLDNNLENEKELLLAPSVKKVIQSIETITIDSEEVIKIKLKGV